MRAAMRISFYVTATILIVCYVHLASKLYAQIDPTLLNATPQYAYADGYEHGDPYEHEQTGELQNAAGAENLAEGDETTCEHTEWTFGNDGFYEHERVTDAVDRDGFLLAAHSTEHTLCEPYEEPGS
jgi:hypothetical protein